MPKYNVNVTFDLGTSIEFDGNIGSNVSVDGVEEITDNSYFSSEEIRSSGGEADFVIIADDEDEAESKAREAIDDGHEYEDSSGITWIVQDANFSVEATEMDRDAAVEIVQRLLDRLLFNGQINAEEKEALEVFLAA